MPSKTIKKPDKALYSVRFFTEYMLQIKNNIF